ncbi:MAG: nucleotide exchange factor GrpE [Candidatus Thorarchaeota archaeon]|jgi:molecular chaperone GrpE
MSEKKNENQEAENEPVIVDLEVDSGESETTPIDDLNAELKESKLHIDELQDKYRRLQAEFDNYKKLTQSRYDEVTKIAGERIILKMLEVYDNLERSLEEGFKKDLKEAKEGIEAISRQMISLLQKEGVRPIESLGKEFDPYYQYAVGTIHDEDEPDGVVTDVYQKGYMIREKVLRPAKVVVNRHESTEMAENKSDDEDKGEY